MLCFAESFIFKSAPVNPFGPLVMLVATAFSRNRHCGDGLGVTQGLDSSDGLTYLEGMFTSHLKFCLIGSAVCGPPCCSTPIFSSSGVSPKRKRRRQETGEEDASFHVSTLSAPLWGHTRGTGIVSLACANRTPRTGGYENLTPDLSFPSVSVCRSASLQACSKLSPGFVKATGHRRDRRPDDHPLLI